jgi:hypothetical protein
MKVNFKINNNTAIDFEEIHVDLHNNFDFIGFEYLLKGRTIFLRWTKSDGEWVHKDEFAGLILTHKNVTFLKITEQDENSTPEDDCCLGEITFFPSSAREFVDCMLDQELPKVGDDIRYYFEGGQQIIIHCDEIELTTYK